MYIEVQYKDAFNTYLPSIPFSRLAVGYKHDSFESFKQILLKELKAHPTKWDKNVNNVYRIISKSDLQFSILFEGTLKELVSQSIIEIET